MGRGYRGCPWAGAAAPPGVPGGARPSVAGPGRPEPPRGAAGPAGGSGSRAGPCGRSPERRPVPPPNLGRAPLREVRGRCSGELSAPRGAGRARGCAALRSSAARAGGALRWRRRLPCRVSGARPALPPLAAAPGAGLRAGDARGRRGRHGGERDRHGSARPAPAIGSAVAISYGSRGGGGGPGAPCVSGAAPAARSPRPCPAPSARAWSRERLRLERGNE